jgi:tetratricopeptide (TPR) repeat protein
MKNYLEAIDCFNKALELNPDCSEYFTFKGKALKHLNQMDAAINCYNEAIKKNQNYAPAYFLLSEYFYEQKNYESALSAIDKACYVDSSDSSYKSFRFNIQKSNKFFLEFIYLSVEII